MIVVVCFCGAKFASTKLLQQHANEKGHLFQCNLVSCGALFKSEKAVVDHQTAVKHQGPIATLVLPKDHTPGTASTADVSLKCTLCPPNRRSFKDASALEQHTQAMHEVCPTCNQVFESKTQRRGHQEATGHCYCAEHQIAYRFANDYKGHMSQSIHASTFQCLDCEREFRTQQGLDDHLLQCPASSKEVTVEQSERAKAVFAAAEEANLHCEECNRTFKTITALRQHKESVKHKPLAHFTCNAVPGKCNQAFTSYSAWFFHIESGKCKSGMTRKKLHSMVRAGDKGNLITYPSSNVSTRSVSGAGLYSRASITGSQVSDLEHDIDRLSISAPSEDEGIATPIDSDEFFDANSDFNVKVTPGTSEAMSDTSSTSGVLLTPSATTSRSRSSTTGGVMLTPPLSTNSPSEWPYITDSHRSTPATTSVDASSTATVTYENLTQFGQSWPCPMCPRTFKDKSRLLQHLKSPAHDPKLFHCPPAASVGLNLGKREKSFKTLSGLAQHIEAGACTGGVGLLKTFIDVCQSKSKFALGQVQNLIRERS